MPPVIAPLITFAAANETTPSLVGEEPANAVSKLKPSVFVFTRQTDPLLSEVGLSVVVVVLFLLYSYLVHLFVLYFFFLKELLHFSFSTEQTNP